MVVKFWVEDEHDSALQEKMVLKLCKIRGIVLDDMSCTRLKLISERTGKPVTEYTVTFLDLKENKYGKKM